MIALDADTERYEIEAPAGTLCKCGQPATTRVLVRSHPRDPGRRQTQRHDRCAACLIDYRNHLEARQ